MINDIKQSAEQKMHKSLEVLKADLGKVRTGRAHTGILDHVQVAFGLCSRCKRMDTAKLRPANGNQFGSSIQLHRAASQTDHRSI